MDTLRKNRKKNFFFQCILEFFKTSFIFCFSLFTILFFYNNILIILLITCHRNYVASASCQLLCTACTGSVTTLPSLILSSYSSIASEAFFKFSIGSQVASWIGYPFQRTLYWTFVLFLYFRTLLSSISSTSKLKKIKQENSRTSLWDHSKLSK